MFMILLLQLLLVMEIRATGSSEFGLCNSTTCLLTWTRQYENRSGVCKCGPSLASEHHYAGSCSVSQLSGGHNVSINIDYCMTFDEESNITYMGKCPYNNLPFHLNSDSIPLPQELLTLNDVMCNATNFTGHHYLCGEQRRQGMLCGKCENGLGPAVMSYTHQCVECQWYGWLLYLALSIIPATVLCFLIILLRINVLSPPLNAVVLLCHVMASYVNHIPCRFLYYADVHHVSKLVVAVLTVYGLFNMDFFSYVFPPFCISSKMSTLNVIALDYIVALYPLVLSAVIYLLIEIHDRGCRPFVWVWKPFHMCLVRFRRSWDIKGSIINAFATLYVLSFTKVVSTSVDLMLTTDIIDVCGTPYWAHLYYDASCVLFHKCHCPYAIVTLTIAITVIIFPSLFIFLHPCKVFHKYKCCKCCKLRLTLLPHEVAKIFHHSFKDGTDGTLDCRWFAGIYLLLRIVIATSVNVRTTQHIQVISSVTGLLLVAVFQPYTRTIFNCTDSFLFGGLAILFMLLPAGQSHHITQVLIFFIPALVIVVLLGCKLIQKFGGKVKSGLYHYLRLYIRLPSENNSRVNIISQEQEQLLVKPSVVYTVVE